MSIATFPLHIRYAFYITLVLLLLWLVPPAATWFKAFVKLESMRLPYTGIFFSVLLLLLTVVGVRVIKKHFLIVTAVGAIVGQLVAFVSIFIANFFIANGVQRTVKTINQEGLSTVLTTDFVASLILGGWLIGAIAFGILKIMMNRTGRISES